MDKLLRREAQRLWHHQLRVWVQGRERTVRVADAEVLLRGVWASRPLVVRGMVETIPHSPLKH